MSKFLSKYGSWGLTLLLGTAAFLFWYLRYPAALAYQEQLQLFLWTGDYLCSRLSEPGGVARYVAELLVQFYNIVIVGALILAILFMAVQRLTLSCTRSIIGSFVVILLLWYAMGDENVLLTYVVALIMALAIIKMTSPSAFSLFLIPIIYWLIGPLVLLVALCVAPQYAKKKWYGMAATAVAVLCAFACIIVSARFLPYPIERLMLSTGYYRVPMTLPYILLIAIPMLIWVLVMFNVQSPKLKVFRIAQASMQSSKLKVIIYSSLFIVYCLLLIGLLATGFDERKYDLLEYDYYVRTGNWNAIVKKSEQKQPDLPMSVCATNLALAMTHQLEKRALQFYQHGSEGLLPPFERNFATQQLTGEAYFQLGLINTAQRFAFEAMEAIPNYNKSGRVIKRLAESNLINGQYDVARKYLHLLQHTIFYRKWAQRTEALLGQEEQIDAHPLYGRLRRNSLQEDFLFSEKELDKICGQLFLHNPDNSIARQYLLTYPLLQKDMGKYRQYQQVVRRHLKQ